MSRETRAGSIGRMSSDQDLRQRLRVALVSAMKARDTVATPALRSALSAIDNAEAVPVGSEALKGLAIEEAAIGAGATEAARRTLTETDIEAVVRADIDERTAAALEYERANQPERAEVLRAQAQILAGFLK